MNKPDFLFLLLGASYASFKFAKEFVKNDLKSEFKYDLELNISHDNPELKQFEIYPEDNGKKYFDLTDKEVVGILCRNNKVPVWIDIGVSKSDKKKTTFRLACSGRYSDDKDEFYYKDGGVLDLLELKAQYILLDIKMELNLDSKKNNDCLTIYITNWAISA